MKARALAANGVEVAHDVELVEDDTCVWCMVREQGTKGVPPVHRGELDARRFFGAQRGKEEVHAGFGAALTADPDGPPAIEITGDDAVVLPLPDGDLVHADRPRGGQAGAGNLLLHVDPVEVRDRPVGGPSAWGISRQSAPTCIAKRCVKRGFFPSQSRRSTNTLRHRGEWTRNRSNWT